jgi:hypothetical protein
VVSCKKPYKNCLKPLLIRLLAIEKKHLKTLLKTLSVVNLLRYEKVLEEKHLCFFPPTKRTKETRKTSEAK